MKNAVSARVTAEICTALSLYGFFAPAGSRLWALALFAAAVHVCGVAAERLDRPVLRLLCCLPAATALAAAGFPADLIVLSVCWLYAAVRFTSGRFAVAYWAYRREFVVLTVCNATVSLLIAGDPFRLQPPPAAIGFAVAAVMLGICSLRELRSGIPGEPGWSAYGVLELALPLGAAAGLSALLWLFLQGVVYVLFWLAGLIKEPTAPEPPSTASEYHHVPYYYEPPSISGAVGQDLTEELPEPTTVPTQEAESIVRRLPPYVWLIIILAVLTLTVLMILRQKRRKKAAQKAKGTGEEDETETARRGRRGKGAAVSPDRRVRAAYRGYLRFLQQKGQDLRACDTSQDVLTGSVMGESEAERELRRLYLAARYGVGAAVKEADAVRAENLLKTIRGLN